MSRNLNLAAAALVATLSLGFAPTEARAQDLGGFIRIGNDGIRIGVDIRDDDHRHGHSHPRYEQRRERVWHEGYWKIVEVPAVYRDIGHGRHHRRVLVSPARCERIWVEGYWDYESRRVQVGVYRCYDRHDRDDHRDHDRDHDRNRNRDRGRDRDHDRRR
ncbi:MAG: hypothetical protein H6807_10270 [Planctomycetes bacterium]|nr:hypothetical protein [Planctomycetota bacterium]